MGSGYASQPDSLRQEDFQSEVSLGYRKSLSQEKKKKPQGQGSGYGVQAERVPCFMGGAFGCLWASEEKLNHLETLLQSEHRFPGIEAMLDCGHGGGYPSVHTQCRDACFGGKGAMKGCCSGKDPRKGSVTRDFEPVTFMSLPVPHLFLLSLVTSLGWLLWASVSCPTLVSSSVSIPLCALEWEQ